VSAFEPQLPTDPKVDMPDFMVVLRGFDRRQVEMWAAEVAHQIEQERQRADEAEKRAYRVQIENKGAPSFSHLGTHVASILEEAGKSSENMLADAAERAQETVDAAEEEAAEIIKAAEHRAGEIEGEARRTLEEASSEGARVEEEALQAAEEMRAQAEQDARTVLEEARDATDMIWQEAERERLGVEAETIRLETLRHRSLEQLGRVYGHLESVLDEVRAGIGRVEEETEDLDEATAAAAARLGVEPPASSPEESPRFPAPRDARPPEGEDDGDGLELRDGDDGDGLELRDGDDGDGLELRDGDDGDGLGQPDGDGGDGMLAATRPDTPPAPEDAEATQPVPASGTAETTQPTLPGSAAETTQPDPAAAAETPGGDDEGPAGDQDATQRLEPVGNAANNKARSARPGAAKDDKGQP
jgi:cell division septum initiation protein DivIVA